MLAVMDEVTQSKSVILRYVLSDARPENEVKHGFLG
jgi:hypothetical protein